MSVSLIGSSTSAMLYGNSKKKMSYADIAKDIINNNSKATSSIDFLKQNFLGKSKSGGLDLYRFTMSLYQLTPDNKAKGLLEQRDSVQRNPILNLFA